MWLMTMRACMVSTKVAHELSSRFVICYLLFVATYFWKIWWWDIEEQIIKVFWIDPRQNGGFWGPFLVHWNFNLPQNLKIEDLTIPWDRKLETRGPWSCAPFFRTNLSCQNPLDCHMGPTNPVFHENRVFSRFTNKCHSQNIVCATPSNSLLGIVSFGTPIKWERPIHRKMREVDFSTHRNAH